MKKLIVLLGLLLATAAPVLGKQATASAKLQIVTRVNQQLSHINETTTAAFDRQLERMAALLNKISQWGNETTTAVISAAQTAINTAKQANDEQKLKTYVIEFTKESGLRIGASQAKSGLRTDLQTVREKVKTARQAVVDSLKAVKTL